MLCLHGLDPKKGLDLFLHTPGGDGAATQSIIAYIKSIFGNDIRAFIPQIAMSAGTIIALACKSIFMGKHSNLGPVDPQINGIQAYAVLAEIERAYKEILGDTNRIFIWQPILQTYSGGFIQKCWWAKEKVEDMVTGYLKDNMLSGLPAADRENKANEIFKWLTDLSANKGHDHHIHMDECEKEGLNICKLEDAANKKLQDLVLTVHHCYMYTLSNTQAFKCIENHNGRRWLKLQIMTPSVQFMPMPMFMPPTIPSSLSPSGPP
jgi:membrane-bound ClpP family serine protease